MSTVKPVSRKQVPIVPYLILTASGNEKAYFQGCQCQKCGEVYLGTRAICIKCYTADKLEEIKLSSRGEVFTFTVIHQSVPWVKVPYVAGVVRLPEGPVVRASFTGIEADPEAIKVGASVEMVTEVVRQDAEGNDLVAYKFRPVAK